MDEITIRQKHGSSYVIDFTVGWSFGEPRPELVTAQKFNRRNRSDGIGFELAERTLIQKVSWESDNLGIRP